MEIDVFNVLILSGIKLWLILSLSILLLSRSRNTSASTLHGLLFLVLLGLVCVPLLMDRIPGLIFLLLPTDVRVEYLWSYTGDPASKFFTLIGSMYLGVVAFLWLRRLWEIRRVYSLLRQAKSLAVPSHHELLGVLADRLNIKRHIHLVYSDRIATPLTGGDIRPWILLPEESLDWDENRLRRFLLHELAHIARNDWFVKQFAYMMVAIFWVVPVVWRAQAKLEWLAELACDDVVISAEGRRADYANDLLDVTASRGLVGALGLTQEYNHYQRIAAVLDGGRVRQSSRLKFLLHALVFFVLLMVIAGVQITHRPQPAAPEYFQLQPLVIGSVSEVPTEKENFHSSVSPLPDLDLESPPQVRYAPPVSIPEIAVSTPLEKLWQGATNDVLQPLVKVMPEYPSKALRRGREGVVEVTFNILPTGETTQIRILRAQPPEVFDKAAIDAIKQYRYAPQDHEVQGLSEYFEFRLIEDAP